MDELERYLNEQVVDDGDNGRALHEVAYDRLEDAIRHANLRPGTHISVNHLSKVLGLSRTPVRQALQMLAQEGLVDIVPGRTITIASRSIKEILDVIAVRTLLEPQMVKLIARAINPEQINELQALQQQLEAAAAAEDLLTWSKVDVAWHETLSQICPNQTLAEFNLRLRNRIHRNVNVVNKLSWDSLRVGTAEHGEIIAAIAARDEAQAEAVVLKHLNTVRENILTQFFN